MSDLTIAQIKKLKQELDQDLTGRVKLFEDETGLGVDKIEVHSAETANLMRLTGFVQTRIDLGVNNTGYKLTFQGGATPD